VPDRGPVVEAPAATSIWSYLLSTYWVYSPTGKSRYIFPGWWMVFISAAQTYFVAPLQTYSYSVYLRVLSNHFGWPPVQVSVLTALNTEEAAAEALIVGWLLDRFGPRAITVASWIVPAVGYLLLPLLSVFNGNVLWMYVCFGLVAAGGGGFYPAMY